MTKIRQPYLGIRSLASSQFGVSLMEVLVALALFAAVGVTFLVGLQTSGRAVMISQKHVTVESMAKSAMEEVKGLPYVWAPTSYSDNITVNSDLAEQGYSITAVAGALPNPPYDNNDVQKITVTVIYRGDVAFTLEDYKVNR